MSKSGQYAMEHGIDNTDDREPDFETEEQDVREVALWDISRAVRVFDNEPLSPAQADELESYVQHMQERIESARKPF